jgi:hypothetical protein
VNWCVGLVCSLTAWLFVLGFHVRRQTLSLPCVNREHFAGRVEDALAELGYEVNRPTPDRLLGKPSFTSLLFGGTVQIQLRGNSATLSGPKMSVEELRNRLRVQSHLDNNRRTLEDSGWYQEQGRLRGVQLQFRTPGDAGQNVAGEVIAALRQMGATVQCDVGIWAQNDAGMEDVVIEKLVRDTLKRRGITVTVNKKPLVVGDADNRAAC